MASELTHLLTASIAGDQGSAAKLIPLIYAHLRAIAHGQLRGKRFETLQTTGLVHEAYLQLFAEADLSWKDRAHFFAYAATTMRNILVDRARLRLAQKNGGELLKEDIHDVDIGVGDCIIDVLALDQVLTRMSQKYPRLVQVIEMRFFSGMEWKEIGEVLDMNEKSVRRDWQKAKAILYAAGYQGLSS